MDILAVSACSGDKLYDEPPIGRDKVDSYSFIHDLTIVTVKANFSENIQSW